VLKKQGTDSYDDATIAAIEKSLSADRLNGYLSLTAGDKSQAIALHERNTEVSEAIYGVIQGLEIALRNGIHQILLDETGSAEWYERIALKDSETKTLKFAIETIRNCHKPLTPSRVVAQLNFGFWVRLTSGAYEKSLWVPHLYKIFPQKTKRSKLNQKLNKIKDLRNKIAHLERIIDRDLQRDYTEILEAIDWLCPITALWIKSTNRFQKP
jgi:hypothetical protein